MCGKFKVTDGLPYRRGLWESGQLRWGYIPNLTDKDLINRVVPSLWLQSIRPLLSKINSTESTCIKGFRERQ